MASSPPNQTNPRALSLDTLLPELLAEIPTYLPKVNRQGTLLSLGLTCHRLCDVIIPDILYRTIWLEGEHRALNVLNKLTTNQLTSVQGNRVNEHIQHLAIISELTKESRERKISVLLQLQALLDTGGLPNLTALTIHLGSGWFWDNVKGEVVHGFGDLPPPFWKRVMVNCPSLKHVHITEMKGKAGSWGGADAELIEHTALNTLRLGESQVEADVQDDKISLPSQFPRFTVAHFIETLELHLDEAFEEVTSATNYLLAQHFPNLRTLIVDNVHISEGSDPLGFWNRHQSLERVELGPKRNGDWFPQNSPGILPNLKYLLCGFAEAMALLPHVASQLVNLTIDKTCNAQALYLLRIIAPNGILPSLKSLGIRMISSSHARDVILEGNRWYEEGETQAEVSKKKAKRYFDGNYLTTLARAVPGLEELELTGISRDTIESLTSSLRQFKNLRVFIISGPFNNYCPAFFPSCVTWTQYQTESNEGDYSFEAGPYEPRSLEEAMYDLGNGCPTLERIRLGNQLGDLFSEGDLAVRIIREEAGAAVKDLKLGKGWGRLIGREGDW